MTVPGIFEIPIAIRRNINKYDAFVALGCVIKGKTPHFDLIYKTSLSQFPIYLLLIISLLAMVS